ncbi:hypothetical protein PQR65_12440 [Paraburkholderia nemoris]|uniref:hypothetical protein n=1 Tax=Paraburkholderia nemoris TaxID=2793076 RepID=UPI0038BC1217
MNTTSTIAARRERKRKQNRANYYASKSRDAHVLLRLGRSETVELDTLCAALGMSRSALLRTCLPPLLAAISSQLASGAVASRDLLDAVRKSLPPSSASGPNAD